MLKNYFRHRLEEMAEEHGLDDIWFQKNGVTAQNSLVVLWQKEIVVTSNSGHIVYINFDDFSKKYVYIYIVLEYNENLKLEVSKFKKKKTPTQ